MGLVLITLLSQESYLKSRDSEQNKILISLNVNDIMIAGKTILGKVLAEKRLVQKIQKIE